MDRTLEELYGDGAPHLCFEGSEDVPKGGERVPIPQGLCKDSAITSIPPTRMHQFVGANVLGTKVLEPVLDFGAEFGYLRTGLDLPHVVARLSSTG